MELGLLGIGDKGLIFLKTKTGATW